MLDKIVSLSSEHNSLTDEGVGPVSHASRVSRAVIFSGHTNVSLADLTLIEPGADDLLIDVFWSGISTGTERLLWSGDMPPFPGLTYPLVPGYEAVGVVAQSGREDIAVGDHVFIPGSHGFKEASGLFGASAARLVVPAQRVVPLERRGAVEDILLALAATAYHAVTKAKLPDLIIGHGTLGRLMARITIALGGRGLTVWETNERRAHSDDYKVLHPESDARLDYKVIGDASGSLEALDKAVKHAGRQADIVLAGFYAERVSFNFPAAFMRELTFHVAAEWTPEDMAAVMDLRDRKLLSLHGLVTHTSCANAAQAAYQAAFTEPECLKMVLDWRSYHDNAH